MTRFMKFLYTLGSQVEEGSAYMSNAPISCIFTPFSTDPTESKRVIIRKLLIKGARDFFMINTIIFDENDCKLGEFGVTFNRDASVKNMFLDTVQSWGIHQLEGEDKVSKLFELNIM